MLSSTAKVRSRAGRSRCTESCVLIRRTAPRLLGDSTLLKRSLLYLAGLISVCSASVASVSLLFAGPDLRCQDAPSSRRAPPSEHGPCMSQFPWSRYSMSPLACHCPWFLQASPLMNLDEKKARATCLALLCAMCERSQVMF